jgi:hypothetical protein
MERAEACWGMKRAMNDEEQPTAESLAARLVLLFSVVVRACGR